MKSNLRAMRESKQSRGKLTWVTCYDYSFARVIDESAVDLILVGDSGGMVALGYRDTTPVSMTEMIILAQAVHRGAPNKFIVGDMPKGSYEGSDQAAVDNAMRFVKEASCDAVKLEGGLEMIPRVRAIQQSGIPVFGHIGLTPQSAGQWGGYRVVGRDATEREALLASANALQEAGAGALLLEAVPPSVGMEVTKSLDIPVFGIGAGPHVDGQLLILHDLLGLYPDFRPKFAKCFIPEVLVEFTEFLSDHSDITSLGRSNRQDGLRQLALMAINRFVTSVRSGDFPEETFSYSEVRL